jgi:hypothetical protein
VIVTARDDEGRSYNLPVESLLSPVTTLEHVTQFGTLDGVTQVVVRLPDNVIGAPRDLLVKVLCEVRAATKHLSRLPGLERPGTGVRVWTSSFSLSVTEEEAKLEFLN